MGPRSLPHYLVLMDVVIVLDGPHIFDIPFHLIFDIFLYYL